MIMRFWGGHRESDWNSYWRMNDLMEQKDQLAAALEHFGIEEIDICPPLHVRAPVTLQYDFQPVRVPTLRRNGEVLEKSGRQSAPGELLRSAFLSDRRCRACIR